MRGVRSITLAEALKDVEDPRADRVVRYPLPEVLFTVVAGMLCGGDNYSDIAEIGRGHLEWYQEYLPFANGIPGAGTLAAVMRMIDPQQIHEAFSTWMNSVLTERGIDIADNVIAIDGKQARRTKDTDKKPLHVVSAVLSNWELVLGQVSCEQKSNEITAIPRLLDLLVLEGAIVTIDAAGTQLGIAEYIREKGADYLLCVKKNRKKQYQELTDFFAPCLENNYAPQNGGYAKTTDAEHGRFETRECWICNDVSNFPQTSKWKDAAGAAAIRNTTEIDGKTKTEVRYFIYSMSDITADSFLAWRRAHWSIENGLHWVLDITFREDESRARKDYSAENLNAVRHIVFNVLRLAGDPKKSMRVRRIRCDHSQPTFNDAIQQIGFQDIL